MKKVGIYIDIATEGAFQKCKGKYSIVLEYIDKNQNLRTKEVYGGIEDTTWNRMQLLVLTKALEHMKENCEIEVHMAPGYVANAIKMKRPDIWEENGWKNKKGNQVAAEELWKKYRGKEKGHKVKIIMEKENQYSKAQKIQIETRKIVFAKDSRRI